MTTGPYLFIPFDATKSPFYAMVCQYTNAFGRYAVRFFTLDCRPMNPKVLIPLCIAKQYGQLFPLSCSIDALNFKRLRIKI